MSIDVLHRRVRFWLETPTGAVAATWFQPPAGVPSRMAVLVVPGIAHEDRTTSTGLAAIAEAFAAAGTPTLLFDLEGTAQSTGDLDTPGIVERWPHDVRAAVEHMRTNGFERIVLIGVRTGGLLATVSLGDDPVDAIVLWSPITSGRRYGRELRLLQNVSNLTGTELVSDIEIAGFAIPDGVIRSLRTLDVSRIDRSPAPRVLIIDAPEREHSETAGHLRSLGADVDELAGPETDAWINRTTDGSSIPEGDIRLVLGWVQAAGQAWAATPAHEVDASQLCSTREIDHRGTLIRETLITVADGSLSAVWSEPIGDEPIGDNQSRVDSPARILVPAVGPGRSFVEFARGQAVEGYSSLRVDLSGFGTSPRRAGEPWSGYYSTVGRSDIHAAIDEAVSRGKSRVVLVGFCATAWSALLARDRPEIVGLVALNIHLYVRDRPASILNGVGHNWIERAVDRRLPRNRRTTLYHGAYRRLPLPALPLRWTDELLSRSVRVIMMFDSHDDGLIYLHRRMPQHWAASLAAGDLQLNTYPALGHALEGPTDRARMLDDLRDQLVDLDAVSGPRAAQVVSPRRRRARSNRRSAGSSPVTQLS